MFAENNYEPANNVFRKIYAKRKNRKFLLCITFFGSWKCPDWFKLHRITEDFYSVFSSAYWVVAERRRFFLTSFLRLIEILQNHFFRLHNYNKHTTLKFHSDSQVDLNMNKASNSAEECRNRKNHTKPYDRILEATRIQVSSETDENVLLSRNNPYLRFGITYPTGRFYKDNWLRNHRNQAALIKSPKNVSAILLGDSIIAGF